jgi:hypothetical protein
LRQVFGYAITYDDKRLMWGDGTWCVAKLQSWRAKSPFRNNSALQRAQAVVVADRRSARNPRPEAARVAALPKERIPPAILPEINHPRSCANRPVLVSNAGCAGTLQAWPVG